MRRPEFLLALGLITASATTHIRAQVSELPLLSLEYAGAYSRGMTGGERFSLHVFADGLVVYQGERNVRVHGAVRSQISPEVVARWIRELQAGGFSNQLDTPIPQDASWYRLTVHRDGHGRTINFAISNQDSYLGVVTKDIFETIKPFEQWVKHR